jgi:hypothetical protein
MISLKVFILFFWNIPIHADAQIRRAAGDTPGANGHADKNSHFRVRQTTQMDARTIYASQIHRPVGDAQNATLYLKNNGNPIFIISVTRSLWYYAPDLA